MTWALAPSAVRVVMAVLALIHPSAAPHTASANGAWALLLAAGALATGRWLWHCWRHPWGPCRACRGRAGRSAGSTSTRWGRCRRCGGSGERQRTGARLFHKGMARTRR